MAHYSTLVSGQVTSLGGSTPVVLPFVPNFIEIENKTRQVAGSGITSARWYTDMGQGAASANLFGTGEVYIDVVGGTSSGGQTNGTGFSTLSGGIALQYGPVNQHGGSPVSDFQISKAASAGITTVGNHGLVTGNVVVFSNLAQTSTTGMQQIAGIPFAITVTGATTFTIPWNTNQSNYTAFNTATSTNNVGSFKQVLFPALYVPGTNVISAITTGATTLVTTTTPHNFSVGQEVAFRIPASWGTTQLNSLPNALIPGSPIYGFVTVVNSSTQVTVNIVSTGFTAFNSNQTFAAFPGEKFPQIVAVGDINSGSLLSNFTSPSIFNGYNGLTTATQTINGPAIAGAYINGTFQGFIIGSGVAGSTSDVIFWRAYLHDQNT